MENTPTSFYANLLTVSEALKRRYGIDTDAMLAEVGVDLKAAARDDQRVPFEAVDRFWALAVEAIGNPTIGLDVVEDLNPAVYRSLGVALLCSDSLRDFFQRFERFFAVISTLEYTSFVEMDGFAVLTASRRVEYSHSTVGCHADVFAAFVVKFIRILYKPDYSPVKILLASNPATDYQPRYLEWFGCPVEFGQENSQVFVDPADLDVELAGANPDITLVNDRLALSILEQMSKLDLPARVYVRLIDFLPSGNCSRARVAASLNMSESAFQKKLKLAGTSYQELLDSTRTELAKHYLVDSAMSVDETAYMLGFSDCSNFSRAFKRWLSIPPREYRESLSDKTFN